MSGVKRSVSIPADDDGRVQARATRTTAEIRKDERTVSDRGNMVMPRGRNAGVNEAEFPAQYFPDSEKEDTRIALKKKLLAGARPLGDAQLTDRDIEWYQKKEEVKQRIVFDQWWSKLFDTTDINKLRLAQEMYPEYYQMREQEIDRQSAIQKKLAMIKLRGPADLSDITFIYALQNGEVNLRAVPLYNLDKADVNTNVRYQKGIFHPTRWIKAKQSFNIPQYLGRGILTNDGSVNTIPNGGVWNTNDANTADFTGPDAAPLGF